MATTQTHFLISETIHGGWNRAKKRLGYFALMFVGAIIISELPSIIASGMPDDSIVAMLLSLVGVVISIAISRGILKISVEEARDQDSSWRSLLCDWRELGKYFLASIVYGLIVLAGFLLLIIPGIYWSLKYQYMLFLVVDKNMGIRESMSMSAKMTDGVKWDLIGFSVVTSIVNLLGFLALLVGLFITIPATAVARAKVYDQLLKRV